MGKLMTYKTIKFMFIICAVATIVLAGILFRTSGSPEGTPAELSVLSLVDNGENDFMDIKLVREGTGQLGFGYFRPLYLRVEINADNVNIIATVVGDGTYGNYIWYNGESKKLPEEFRLVDNIVRVHFLEDVAENGKTYQIKLAQLIGAILFEGEVSCT